MLGWNLCFLDGHPWLYTDSKTWYTAHVVYSCVLSNKFAFITKDFEHHHQHQQHCASWFYGQTPYHPPERQGRVCNAVMARQPSFGMKQTCFVFHQTPWFPNTVYEIDESQHKHKSYMGTCELVRLNNIAISSQFDKFWWLCCNPDTFTVGNKRITYKELPRKDKEGTYSFQNSKRWCFKQHIQNRSHRSSGWSKLVLTATA